MGWFTRENDDDIDDIYNKLDDIYNKLEMLDVVTAFSGRLSRLEKTSTYLENILMDTVKDLEKRVESLETNNSLDNITETVKNNPELDRVNFQINFLKDDIQNLKKSLNDYITDSSKNNDINQRFDDVNSIIKNLNLKVSYLEVSKDRNSIDEVKKLKEELSKKDEQIKHLNKKIESITYLIEEDNRNIKMVAKHIIDQANSLKALREEIYYLNKDKNSL